MQLDAFSLNSSPQQPLAAKLRPKSLDDFYGQPKLRSSLEKLISHPRHIVFWGPPGTGKTTLAHIISSKMRRTLFTFNAVTSGVGELKRLIKDMAEHKKDFQQENILFIDEIHHFNKSQQDALLPYLENGDFLFLGATTEYPHTSLNKALLSRISLMELEKLSSSELMMILKRALGEVQRSKLDEYIQEIAKLSNGDARFALNQLSRLCAFEDWELDDRENVIKELFKYARQYDKKGNRHHDVISAFIKSIRGSDPDGALLYLALMLDGGEDPEFIARRLMILASEDVGLANSQGLQVASNAHYVVKHIGMPQARITLSHATVFLALAPKSNSIYEGINCALNFVKNAGTIEVPGHLCNVSPQKIHYKYPHDFEGNWVNQSYLPQDVKEKFYHPSINGSERLLNESHSQRRQVK